MNLCKKDINNIRESFYLKPIHILEDEIWPVWFSDQPILKEELLKYVEVANIEKGNMEFRELLCIFYWYAPKFHRILLNTKPNPLFQSCQGHPKLEVSSMPISFLFSKLFWSYNAVKPIFLWASSITLVIISYFWSYRAFLLSHPMHCLVIIHFGGSNYTLSTILI